MSSENFDLFEFVESNSDDFVHPSSRNPEHRQPRFPKEFTTNNVPKKKTQVKESNKAPAQIFHQESKSKTSPVTPDPQRTNSQNTQNVSSFQCLSSTEEPAKHPDEVYRPRQNNENLGQERSPQFFAQSQNQVSSSSTNNNRNIGSQQPDPIAQNYSHVFSGTDSNKASNARHHQSRNTKSIGEVFTETGLDSPSSIGSEEFSVFLQQNSEENSSNNSNGDNLVQQQEHHRLTNAPLQNESQENTNVHHNRGSDFENPVFNNSENLQSDITHHMNMNNMFIHSLESPQQIRQAILMFQNCLQYCQKRERSLSQSPVSSQLQNGNRPEQPAESSYSSNQNHQKNAGSEMYQSRNTAQPLRSGKQVQAKTQRHNSVQPYQRQKPRSQLQSHPNIHSNDIIHVYPVPVTNLDRHFPDAFKNNLIAEQGIKKDEKWLSITPTLYDMLETRKIARFIKDRNGKLGIIFVGPANKEFQETSIICRINNKKTYSCAKDGCDKCFTSFKTNLFKGFRSKNKETGKKITGQARIVCYDKEGQQRQPRVKFEESWYFMLKMDDDYSLNFEIGSPNFFQEFSKNVGTDFKDGNENQKKAKASTTKKRPFSDQEQNIPNSHPSEASVPKQPKFSRRPTFNPEYHPSQNYAVIQSRNQGAPNNFDTNRPNGPYDRTEYF